MIEVLQQPRMLAVGWVCYKQRATNVLNMDERKSNQACAQLWYT